MKLLSRILLSSSLILQLIFVLTTTFASFAFAGVDREIQESKKCSSMFSYFENRYSLPRDILHSISLQETGKAHSKHKIGVVWPWTINVEGKGFHFKTKNEAIRFVKEQMAEGKSSIDVGCMQINLKHHPEAFSSLEQAFSPRQNIAYAAQLLKDHYSRHGNWDKAIGQYHSGTEDRAKVYQASVSKISSKMAVYKQDLSRYSRSADYKNLYMADAKEGMRANLRPRSSYNRGKEEIRISRMKSHDLFRRVQQ